MYVAVVMNQKINQYNNSYKTGIIIAKTYIHVQVIRIVTSEYS